MKLLYMQEYFERHLYVIEHDGKFIQVYRSSGLSGTGHKGQLLPFSGINSGTRGFDSPGYIYKEMYYDRKWRKHYKEIENFHNAKENMDIINTFIGDTIPTEITPLETFEAAEKGKVDWNKLNTYFVKIADELRTATGNLEPYDLSILIKETK